MKRFFVVLRALILIIIFWALHNSHGSLPPFGKLFDPINGFWANNRTLDDIPDILDVNGLFSPVTVAWGERQVPHIFAENDHDLYFAQGYLMARHRIWQMDFVTSVAAGRVSEIIGEKALGFDKKQRRLGLLYGAEQALDFIKHDEATFAAVQAYTDGINAWQEQLPSRFKALEYKVLNYEPEPWTPLKTSLLLKYMAWDLTGRNVEHALTAVYEKYGQEALDHLYPSQTSFLDPIISKKKKWRFDPIKFLTKDSEPKESTAWFQPNHAQPDPHNGSNNWAISAERTSTGYPILSNDPHLGLNLPSIWYELQLVSPTQNVYGVALPGSPGVIIGYNDSIAWGVTNGGSDVFDWYDMRFENPSMMRYEFDGQWENAKFRIEEFHVRKDGTHFDSIPMTRFGPVVYSVSKDGKTHGMAMRWTAHDPSNELKTFLDLDKATNYDDYRKALVGYSCPAQNFAFASIQGDIAITHNGKFPLRKPHQGDAISSGLDSSEAWHGWIPMDQVPTIKNPSKFYVSSGNQNPVNEKYPYYLGWNYASYERGKRINDLLDETRHANAKNMMKIQLDNFNLHAQAILPTMLNFVSDSACSETGQNMLGDLKNWKYENTAGSKSAMVFKLWWTLLSDAIWSDLLPEGKEGGKYPNQDRQVELFAEILSEKTSYPWMPTKDVFEAKVQSTYNTTIDSMISAYGEVGEAWAQGKARGTDINHLLKIKGWGRTNLNTNGGDMIVNATKKIHGPSWRMIVELGPEITAYGVYPGGQSRNPGSQYFDNMVNSWVEGKNFQLHKLNKPGDLTGRDWIGTTVLRNTQ